MWAACLDKSGEMVKTAATILRKLLETSLDRVPFTDWYDAQNGKQIEFMNRTVLGGLWMPILISRKPKVNYQIPDILKARREI
jgi:hypothetical protein